MAGLFGLVDRILKMNGPPAVAKEPGALRIGILGAARIAPAALILPARSHPGVVVAAVAARDKSKGEKYAKTHGIPKVFSSYQEMLESPDIDAIYNPLPNGLHFEWTMKALDAGKHVLLEKPSCNTAQETKALFEKAREKDLVLLEAFHYRFHPVAQRLREIVRSGELGRIKSVSAALAVPRGIVAQDDIRFKWDLGGGALMDMGVYPLSFVRFVLDADPTQVLSAHASPFPGDPARVDAGTVASLAFPNDVVADIECHLAMPPRLGIVPRMFKLGAVVRGEKGEARVFNYVLPTAYHYITVNGRTEKVYKPKDGKGEEWWSTYRYQLEAFVDKVRGREPHYWMEGDDSVKQMEAVEQIYEKMELGVRPKSSYVPA
ncbi:NAD(P)-binding protein [Auricularia subglabra TFB-10046 SS5]|nr:NAD(P)-binding protein [Auricularia subglabra TFB-10046 SS5]